MCIVVDVNCLKETVMRDIKYLPIMEWFENCKKASLVMGGTKFENELKKMPSVLNYIIQNKNAQKIRVSYIKNEILDEEQKRIESLKLGADFDDPHLVALLKVSGCRLIATQDKRATAFVKHPVIFPKNKPKIYSSEQNRDLLIDKNIVKLTHVANPQ